jgi:hypothetical protein
MPMDDILYTSPPWRTTVKQQSPLKRMPRNFVFEYTLLVLHNGLLHEGFNVDELTVPGMEQLGVVGDCFVSGNRIAASDDVHNNNKSAMSCQNAVEDTHGAIHNVFEPVTKTQRQRRIERTSIAGELSFLIIK